MSLQARPSTSTFKGTGGVVTRILVKPGSKVAKGQVMATVDATSAEQGVAKAQVQLESAQASYATTVQGQTSAEYQRDERSIDQSQAAVASARSSLRSARSSLALTRKQQNAAVARAEHDVDVAQDEAALAVCEDGADAGERGSFIGPLAGETAGVLSAATGQVGRGEPGIDASVCGGQPSRSHRRDGRAGAGSNRQRPDRR